MPDKLAYPIPEDLFENISQAFGVQSSMYVSGVHNGTDFSINTGTPVFALFDGTVTKIQRDHHEMGNVFHFSFEFENVWYTARYMHLSQLPDKLHYMKGEQVGKSGRSGRTTGPHLHLDIQKNAPTFSVAKIYTRESVFENMVDPYEFIKENV